MQKIVVLFDTHIPFHINLKPVFDFIADYQPDQVILGGDLCDWSSVNHWLSDMSRHLDGGIIKEDYRLLHEHLLNPLMMAAGKRCKKVLITGNHEEFLTKAANADPNLRGYIELQHNIDFKKYNMTLVPVNQPYRIGSNLIVIHGLYTNLYHARKTVESYHVSTLYGHVHTFQSHMLVSPVDSTKFYLGQAVGCLCGLNPGFMKNRPNTWVNGLCYVTLNGDDSFQHTPIIIVNGEFRANGKRYL